MSQLTIKPDVSPALECSPGVTCTIGDPEVSPPVGGGSPQFEISLLDSVKETYATKEESELKVSEDEETIWGWGRYFLKRSLLSML